LADNPSITEIRPDSDHAWLAEVARETSGELVAFLRRRLSVEADADDLSQEVYIRLLRVKHPDDIRNWRAYVLRVAANVAYEWNMLARNRRFHSSELVDGLTEPVDIVDECYVDQQMRVLTRAVANLSPKCRQVLMMHRRDKYTYEEIAKQMSLSVSMVKKYLTKALSECQIALAEND